MDWLKKMFTSQEGKASMTKIGGTLVSAAGTVLAIAGAGVVMPPVVLIGAAAVLFFGGKMTADGLRNAISSVKK